MADLGLTGDEPPTLVLPLWPGDGAVVEGSSSDGSSTGSSLSMDEGRSGSDGSTDAAAEGGGLSIASRRAGGRGGAAGEHTH